MKASCLSCRALFKAFPTLCIRALFTQYVGFCARYVWRHRVCRVGLFLRLFPHYSLPTICRSLYTVCMIVVEGSISGMCHNILRGPSTLCVDLFTRYVWLHRVCRVGLFTGLFRMICRALFAKEPYTYYWKCPTKRPTPFSRYSRLHLFPHYM